MLKLLIFMGLFLFVGCGTEEIVDDEPLEVTVHFAIEDGLGSDEWQDFITITIDTEYTVTAIEMNSVTPLANNLRRDIAQIESFEDAFGYNFYEQASNLEESLIGIASNELAQAIQNAYVDFDTAEFANLTQRALAYGPVERGQYLDGAYHSIQSADEREDDLQYFVNFYIINGYIVAVHFNALDHEGRLKVDVNDTGVWRHQAQLLEQALISIQDPMEFSFDDAGYTTNIPGVDFEIESFVSLVIQALAVGPIVDREVEE